MPTNHQSQGNHGSNTKRDNDKDSGSHSGSHSKSASGNPGNFANDREKASEAGRKGGEHSHGGGRSSSRDKDNE